MIWESHLCLKQLAPLNRIVFLHWIFQRNEKNGGFKGPRFKRSEPRRSVWVTAWCWGQRLILWGPVDTILSQIFKTLGTFGSRLILGASRHNSLQDFQNSWDIWVTRSAWLILRPTPHTSLTDLKQACKTWDTTAWCGLITTPRLIQQLLLDSACDVCEICDNPDNRMYNGQKCGLCGK